VLTGIGGINRLATWRGTAHLARRMDQDSHAGVAAMEGLGVAVTGTAKTLATPPNAASGLQHRVRSGVRAGWASERSW